jgi:hypothetical protein
MATIHAEVETFMAKNSMGHWASGKAGEAKLALDDLVDAGKDAAVRLAPRGPAHNRAGHVHFKDSIVDAGYSSGQERGWGTIAKHFWWYVRGTGAHPITGKMRFDWDGGNFHWRDYRFGPYGSGKAYENWDESSGATVRHPGTGPHPNWLKASFDAVAPLAPSFLKRRMG